jgi:hypothetical protein
VALGDGAREVQSAVRRRADAELGEFFLRHEHDRQTHGVPATVSVRPALPVDSAFRAFSRKRHFFAAKRRGETTSRGVAPKATEDARARCSNSAAEHRTSGASGKATRAALSSGLPESGVELSGRYILPFAKKANDEALGAALQTTVADGPLPSLGRDLPRGRRRDPAS